MSHYKLQEAPNTFRADVPRVLARITIKRCVIGTTCIIARAAIGTARLRRFGVLLVSWWWRAVGRRRAGKRGRAAVLPVVNNHLRTDGARRHPFQCASELTDDTFL